ncbi:hypothetical protein PV04_04391 [Phialophora macrospora]|uniref:NAD(P)-binding domain-containing protein n=1 Tax=Phialophora macrospora TaxID=1851006 RepID=A0A0D2FK02_9EURO|nr:hypothetical protein PV04_04391 [Phialophora macrospora]
MASVLLLGSTGLVGSFILSILRTAPPSQVSGIEILARRSPPPPSAAAASIPVSEFINKDLATWGPHIESLPPPPPAVLFSALATTRVAAGGYANQYKLEHDKNIELARAAHKIGTKSYVLISSGGADPKSWMSYLRMKGEIDQHVQDIGFEHTVILRPGLIIGAREESRLAESVFRAVALGLGKINSRLFKDSWAVEAEVIAKAAVVAGLKAARGEVKEKVWIVGQQEILKLGKTEWKGLS